MGSRVLIAATSCVLYVIGSWKKKSSSKRTPVETKDLLINVDLEMLFVFVNT
jgi:hypothetical protein